MLSWLCGCNIGSKSVLVAIVNLLVVLATIDPVPCWTGSMFPDTMAARLMSMKAYAGVSTRVEHLCLSYYATPRACEYLLGGTMMMMLRVSCSIEEPPNRRRFGKSPVPDQCSAYIVYLCRF